MDTADRELESCPAGAGLGLSLHLASLATARHLCSALIKVCKTVAIIEDRNGLENVMKDFKHFPVFLTLRTAQNSLQTRQKSYVSIEISHPSLLGE